MATAKPRFQEHAERVTIYSRKATKQRFQAAAAELSQQSDPFLDVLLDLWDAQTFEQKAAAVRNAAERRTSNEAVPA